MNRDEGTREAPDAGGITEPGRRPRDRSVIAPEKYLGATLEGRVADSSTEGGGRLTLRFSRLRTGDARLTASARVARFVNSKGHPFVGEDGRPATVEGGAIVWQGPGLHLEEGAELDLVATPER